VKELFSHYVDSFIVSKLGIRCSSLGYKYNRKNEPQMTRIDTEKSVKICFICGSEKFVV